MGTQNNLRLLVVGPLPPPLAGTSVSFKLFCQFVQNHADNLQLEVINTAPKDVGEKPLLSGQNLLTAVRILCNYFVKVWRADKIVVFGSNKFLLSLMPICLGLAKIANKRCYVRVFGGSLERFYLELPPVTQKYFNWVLGNADGILVQTQILRDFFERFYGDKVHYIPGYRKVQRRPEPCSVEYSDKEALRIVYVGHIREEKGVFDIIESLAQLSNEGQPVVNCDLYGPVYADIFQRFEKEIEDAPNVSYKGVLEPHDVVTTLEQYDVFVFPSFYQGEGHPGVLIEAMAAGLPIITTRFGSIPELVEHRKNGLLVAPGSPLELAEAIKELSRDKSLLVSLAERSSRASNNFSSSRVIPQLLSAMDINL